MASRSETEEVDEMVRRAEELTRRVEEVENKLVKDEGGGDPS